MEHQQKIHLSVQDLQYLQRQFVGSVEKKLDLHLPKEDGRIDPLRDQVQFLVHEFVNEIFETAQHSLAIDGYNPMKDGPLREFLVDPPAEEVEPFDMELKKKVQELYQQVEEATVTVTTLRREAPKQTTQVFHEKCTSALGQLDKLIADDEVSDPEEHHALDVPPSKDLDRVLELLAKIKSGIPERSAEFEKLKKLVEFMG